MKFTISVAIAFLTCLSTLAHAQCTEKCGAATRLEPSPVYYADIVTSSKVVTHTSLIHRFHGSLCRGQEYNLKTTYIQKGVKECRLGVITINQARLRTSHRMQMGTEVFSGTIQGTFKAEYENVLTIRLHCADIERREGRTADFEFGSFDLTYAGDGCSVATVSIAPAELPSALSTFATETSPTSKMSAPTGTISGTPTSTVGPYKYLGCYVGLPNGALTVKPVVAGKSEFNLDSCADFCQGKTIGNEKIYKYMSVKDRTQCMCSDELEGTHEYSNQSLCLEQCSAENEFAAPQPAETVQGFCFSKYSFLAYGM